MVEAIQDSQFEQLVLKGEGLILVDFWASWCGPCKQLVPVLEDINRDKPEILIYKVNVDDNPATAARYAVMALPTLILFKEGHVMGRFSGLASKAVLLRWIGELTAS